MSDLTMCRIPVVGCMVKNPATGEWELKEEPVNMGRYSRRCNRSKVD